MQGPREQAHACKGAVAVLPLLVGVLAETSAITKRAACSASFGGRSQLLLAWLLRRLRVAATAAAVAVAAALAALRIWLVYSAPLKRCTT